MRLFGKNLDAAACVIAEIGVNHEGDVEAASRLIALAREAGADAAKLQTYTPERYAAADDQPRLERVRRFALSEADHRRLAREARDMDFPLFSTALSEDVTALLAELFPALKIASGDLDFEPAVRAAGASGKVTMLSTGLGLEDEIERAIDWFKDELEEGADLRDRLILMHCVSAYPTPMAEANVLSVPYLAERFGLRTGYSNHVIGPEAVLAAVALGAPVAEVHFTDQKEGREFRDHALSFDPDDLAALVKSVAAVRASLGVRGKHRMPCEEPNLEAVRKGVVAARDLPAGTALTETDLMFARPAAHFPAGRIGELTGRTLKADVKRGESLRPAHLAD
ncbi:MAG: N-acetylneuraminate synthase family protein [Rhodospirillales bacterium]